METELAKLMDDGGKIGYRASAYREVPTQSSGESGRLSRRSVQGAAVSIPGILDRLADPIFVVSDQRNVSFHNAAAARVLDARVGIGMRNGKLTFPDSKVLQLFHELARGGEKHLPSAGSSCRAIRMSCGAGCREWFAVVHLHFLADSAKSESYFILHLVRRLNPRRLPAKALVDLFGLTRMELSVLQRLIRNETLRDIAVCLSLSYETIRTYLKRIFRKCDVKSQVELLALLQRVSLLA